MNMNYIIYFFAGIAGLSLGWWMAVRCRSGTVKTFASKTEAEMKEVNEKSREALTERTEDRLEKILEMMREAREEFAVGCNLREGENKKGITTGDVEKLLDVSDDTARKYLNKLEKAGKIKQIGDAGKNVYYILAE